MRQDARGPLLAALHRARRAAYRVGKYIGEEGERLQRGRVRVFALVAETR